MADDTDFLEGNAPELPAANPMPRPRAPITPVPAPKRAESGGQNLPPRPAPRSVVPESLDREMRLDPPGGTLADPLLDGDLPVPAAKPQRPAVPDIEGESEEDPLRSPDFPNVRVRVSVEEEISDEDLMPVQRGVAVEEEPVKAPAPEQDALDETPPPNRSKAPRSEQVAPHEEDVPPPSPRRVQVSQDEPPPVPTARVRPMQVPRSEAKPVETPSLTVDRSSTPASELDMHDDLPDEPVGEEDSTPDPAELKPKKGFKLPAWLVVLGVLLVAAGGFYMLLPFITKKGDAPKVPLSDIDKIVEAASEDAGSEATTGDFSPEEDFSQDLGSTPDVESGTPVNDMGDNTDVGQPAPLTVGPQTGAPSLVPVRLDRYTLTTTMIYRPGPQQSGPVQQLGVFDDGGREIYVAKIMYGPNDLQGPSRFLAKVQGLADSSLASSLKKGAAVLNGPSALNNARVPASIYSITETRTDMAGAEMREMKTYMIVDADDGCLVFAVQTPDSDTGYGLTKFIEMSSQLE